MFFGSTESGTKEGLLARAAGKRWFILLVILLFFVPPVCQRGFSLEKWGDAVRATLWNAWISRLDPVQPYLHAVVLVVLLLALLRPQRFMRLFHAYAALSFFVFAVVQGTAWTDRYGYSLLPSNFFWFSLVGLAWTVEALSKTDPQRCLRFHRWHAWAIPLCVYAFWAPKELWPLNPGDLVRSLSPLAFCLMTPIYLSIHAGFYPRANLTVLRLTGTAGLIIAVINMANAALGRDLHGAVLHFPLLATTCWALVLARRQKRAGAHRAASGTESPDEDVEGTVPESVNGAVWVQGLTKRYSGRAVVDNVSFSVKQGELFGLLGPNGAGKTTTVECIAGLRAPDAGVVRVGALDPQRDVGELRKRLGIQLQRAALPEGLTVREAVRYFSLFYGNVVDGEALLEQLDLAGCGRTLYGKLSGGQRQRLHFVLSLLGDPDVVIVDEPTTGLDPVARQVVWRLLRERKERGKAVILTTHFMEEAQNLCDRIAFIRDGRIVAEGSPAALIQSLGWQIRISFALDRPCDVDLIRRIPGVTNAVFKNSHATVFATDTSDLGSVLDAVRRAGRVVQEVQSRPACLEDVFISLATGSENAGTVSVESGEEGR